MTEPSPVGGGDRPAGDGTWLREDRRSGPGDWTAVSGDGMVASAHHLATDAGAEMLARGGDAVDAAVATSLALCVCEPTGSGLSGMMSLVMHRARAGRTLAIDGACRAPALATPEAVAQAKRYRGYGAVAVPGLPAVLEKVHREHGRLSRAVVFAPAIRLARDGIALTALQHRLIRRFRRALGRHSAARLFLDPAGEPLPAGTVIRQPELAATLERLADVGLADVYEGEVARRICDDMRQHGGFVREQDLADVAAPRDADPLETRFGGLTVRSPGPPAGGIALHQLLNLLDRPAGADLDVDGVPGALRMAATIRRTRTDRRRFRLETGAQTPGGAAELLTPGYAATASDEIDRDLSGAGETSHVSIADRDGNVVSMTQSIERCFGAAEISPSLGIIYNGYLRAFKVQNERHPHFLRPGAIARSNACPTILLEEGRATMAIGSTGSERVASGIAQVLVRMRHASPFDAVAAPRLHCTPDGVVMLEADRFTEAVLEALSAKGYEIKRLAPYSFKVGGLNLVVERGDGWCGVADPRRDGSASGPAPRCATADPRGSPA